MDYSNRDVVRILSSMHPAFDRRVQSDNYSTGSCKYQEGRANGYWQPDRILVEDYFLTLRDEGWPVKLAGSLATRLWTALQDYPRADRLALVTMENSNRFAVLADKLDLASGYNSGGLLREALIIDVRNRRERIARLIETDASLVDEVEDAAA
jgi:hypothetical protein